MSWAKPQYDENPFAGSKDMQSPIWLQEDTGATTSSSVSSTKNVQSSNTSTTANDADSAVPRMILYTRVVNLVLSVCMIIASLLSLLTTDNATTGVLACYVVVFSCLLCCFETHLKQVAKVIALNFGFLYSAKSRCVFMVFVGTILFSFSLFGKIVGCLMLANAGFNAFVLVKFPQYEDAQRSDAQSEIRDYLASNPAFAKHVVKAGAEFVANNPEVIRTSANAWVSSAAAKGDYSRV